jgi:hypothetical protein
VDTGLMHFGANSLATSAMAKHPCNNSENEIKAFVFYSDSEEKFMLNESDIERTHEFPEYTDNRFLKI